MLVEKNYKEIWRRQSWLDEIHSNSDKMVLVWKITKKSKKAILIEKNYYESWSDEIHSKSDKMVLV